MKTVRFEIVGSAPLIVHRFSDEASASASTRRIKLDDATPREQATRTAYVAPNGVHQISAVAVARAIASAGSNHKMRGSRKSLRFVVPSAVRVTADMFDLRDEEGKLLKQCEVDSRPVTIPATKGRIMRHRARYERWKIEGSLVINDAVLDVATVHSLLQEAGQNIGIGDFRPEKTGPFGTFLVSRFDTKAD